MQLFIYMIVCVVLDIIKVGRSKRHPDIYRQEKTHVHTVHREDLSNNQKQFNNQPVN